MADSAPTLDTIFSEAVEIPDDAQRASFVAQACGEDTGLRERIDALLAAHFRAGDFLEVTPSTPIPADWAGDWEACGSTIGPYKLLERLGEGGMGVVYVAEQSHPVARRVALKIVKPGMDSHEIVARFNVERQALALMDHPNIAKVLDAGATTIGRPFFAMELVRGMPITIYCDQARLSAESRLKLFTQVCRAVQHAHQKGIIHRDIKPSNILVTMQDGAPVPKVIDFGVAKAMDRQLGVHSVYTRFTQLIGTPLYMSPEQAELSAVDVDTRSDVYSLGVLLYELLTGTTPFDPLLIKNADFDEMRRIIREDEPPRPSARLSTLDAAARSTVSSKRGLDDRQLSRLLSGDLDWIVMKALEKDRNRRYESAGAFAADIERYLANEPVEARPPSTAYRVRKFVRRNRGLVATGLVVVAVLAAGILGTSTSLVWALRARADADKAAQGEAQQRQDAETQRDRAVTEKARADEETEVAKSVTAFIVKVLEEAAPSNNQHARKISVEEVLDRSSTRVISQTLNRPRIEAAIRTTIGESYLMLGKFDAAEPHLERALEIRRRELGEEHADTLEAQMNLAHLHQLRGQYDLADQIYRKSLEVCARTLHPDHKLILAGKQNLALVCMENGRLAEAESILSEGREAVRRVYGEMAHETQQAIYNLACAYYLQGRADDTEQLLLQLIEASRRAPNLESPLTVAAMNQLALVYDQRKDRAKGTAMFRAAMELSRRVSGEEHPDTLYTMTNVANCHLEQREYAEAEALMTKVVEVSGRVIGEDHPDTLFRVQSLAYVHYLQDEFAQAAPLLMRLVEKRRQRPAETHRQVPSGLPGPLDGFLLRAMLGTSLRGMGKMAAERLEKGEFDAATSLFEQTLRLMKLHFGEHHSDTLTVMHNLAGVYRSADKPELALPLFEEVVRLRTKKDGPDDDDTMTCMNSLAACYWSSNQLHKSVPLFEETLKRRERKLGRNHFHTLGTVANLGVNYLDAGRTAEALPLLQRSYDASKKHPQLRFVRPRLLECYARTGMAAEAIALARDLVAAAKKDLPVGSLQLAGELALIGHWLVETKAFADAEPSLRESLAIRTILEPEKWTTFNSQSMLGAALMGQKKYADAEPLLVKGYEGLKDRKSQIPFAAGPRHLEALERLAQLCDATGRPEEAASWRANRLSADNESTNPSPSKK